MINTKLISDIFGKYFKKDYNDLIHECRYYVLYMQEFNGKSLQSLKNIRIIEQ